MTKQKKIDLLTKEVTRLGNENDRLNNENQRLSTENSGLESALALLRTRLQDLGINLTDEVVQQPSFNLDKPHYTNVRRLTVQSFTICYTSPGVVIDNG